MVNDVPHELEPNDCPQLVKMDLLTQFPSNAFFFSFQRRRDVADSPQHSSETSMSEHESVETEIIDTVENEGKQFEFKIIHISNNKLLHRNNQFRNHV